ncbi:hypothetical protein FZEAL_1615 [Fusarium zealandicum]|uniref:Uncharacterized protein n=1 Tax=Fusarium zealandicum TaxID=1053134 RepID=A0A8H4XNJ0_9HYPO|nr:hypothetical protein FZEAL_1615 [Fusarium zealandicum]
MSSSIGGKHITDAPPIPHTSIGPATGHLKNELVKMYWKGVEREIPYLLLTMRQWQSRDDCSELLPDEEDDLIYGYDTFLDQVSDISRQFHERNRKKKTKNDDSEKKSQAPPSYDQVLRERGWDMYANMKSQRMKESIRESLNNRESLDPVRRRARMLLQSAQFLDIDKIIEYREPEESLSFWKRPASAQIKVTSYDDLDLPVFVPQRCLECQDVIRGSMFEQIDNEAVIICETCYREAHYGQAKFFKNSVRRRDNDGRLRSLWPVDPDLDNGQHFKGGGGQAGCGLYCITDLFAEAKYATTRSKIDRHDTLLHLKKKNHPAVETTSLVRLSKRKPSRLQHLSQTSVPEFGYSYGCSTESPEDIPIYLRSITEKYPYGNVHMALRIGPIIIENGVANTKGGVLITSRDPPSLQVLRDPPEDIKDCLLLTGETDRALHSQVRPRVRKRYKAFMKQIAGGAFCSFFDPEVEDKLIDAFIAESDRLVEDGLSFTEKETMLEQSVKRLTSRLKEYLGSRIETYMSSITARLLDPGVQLRWHFRSNNCQTFCDNLIDRGIFGSLFAAPSNAGQSTSLTSTGIPAPLYLMSFVCRPKAYIKTRALSKFDVPNGLTEEYLLKFRYGRHDDSDIIDTLAEYWYDWGGFEGPIYPYQDVFPWDCTEAYDRYPGNCGQCNISKHVLAFPFDSWSTASLHLARGRELYPCGTAPVPGTTESTLVEQRLKTGLMKDTDWFRNRLTILLGQDALLTAAVAMASCDEFRTSTRWLYAHEDESMDRLKLGGIHRAQPFSHHFEKGAYHQYFVADWAFMAQPVRVAKYEKLRDWRATSEDVGKPRQDDDDGGGGGCGAAPFGCGAMAAGCAAGAPGVAGDTCGSGCVTSCGADGDGDGDGGCGGCGG